MSRTRALAGKQAVVPSTVLELLKPVTWFPPAWAFLCGTVSGCAPGAPVPWAAALAGAVLAGPLACGAAQALNDWCDRDVDAINQPDRPIPSGRIGSAAALLVALATAAAALLLAGALGPLVLGATMLALISGWAYSAPPLRLKADGWAGPALTALSYEGLAWLTGALVVAHGAALHRPLLLAAALLYSAGAHGIMTLNDFKAVAGDRATGVRSLPVRYGVRGAARIACATMLVPQLVVAGLLARHALAGHALAVAALALGQAALMPRLLRDPERFAPWYNGTGVLLFVLGMMVTATAVRALA